MASQTLPMDILFLIMDASSLSTTGKITRTCHALRQGGARFLLDRGVLLAAGASIISFFRFLNADAATRFQHLRALEIATGELRLREVDALLGLISHPLLALDSLTLREADIMLESPPQRSHTTHSADPTPLVTAFSALTTLRHLTVDGCDERACTLIGAIRSPLRTVSMGFTPLTSWNNAEDAEHRNPIVLLANVSETLEEISVSRGAMNPEHVMYDVAYPSVRRVTFDLTYPPRTVAYTTAFPNLTHFSFNASNDHLFANFDVGDLWEYRHAAVNRIWNRENVERYGGSWMHLEELVSDVLDLFALGLSCHVTRLRITSPVLFSLKAALMSVLSDIRPISLATGFIGTSWFEDDSVDSIAATLTQPCAENLRVLEMEVCLDVDEDSVNAQTLLNNVAKILAPIPLRDLTLTLNYGLFANVVNGQPSHPISRDFEGIDLDVAASFFRAALPSLVGIAVRHSMDSTWHDSMRVPRADDDSDSESSGASSGSLEGSELEGDLGDLMMHEDEHGW